VKSPVIILLITSLVFSAIAFTQDISIGLQNLEKQLSGKKMTVSGVLQNNAYMYMHSKTEFRNLIKEYAPVGKITIVTSTEPGKRIKVKCSVTAKNGSPFANALVYAYQTSAKGWYSDTAAHILLNEGDMRHARLFGYVYTDANGEFELETIQPSGYPKSDLPAHIHLAMWKEDKYVSGVPGELLFDEDARLTPERRIRALTEGFLISANTGPASAPLYFYSITLKQ
jgi:protocatechuate 3,4-dioxygenase beta subunit